MIAKKHNDITGPYYWKILKSGKPRYIASKPKGKYVVEYIEEIGWFGQDKMHYLNLIVAESCVYRCDYRSVCGYDRGPKFNNLLNRIWKRG